VFEEFDRGTHTRTIEPAAIKQWAKWRGVDFGFHHSPVYWAAVINKRHVHVFDELDAAQMTTDDLASEIADRDRSTA
jgi:hypothetical protein